MSDQKPNAAETAGAKPGCPPATCSVEDWQLIHMLFSFLSAMFATCFSFGSAIGQLIQGHDEWALLFGILGGLGASQSLKCWPTNQPNAPHEPRRADGVDREAD